MTELTLNRKENDYVLANYGENQPLAAGQLGLRIFQLQRSETSRGSSAWLTFRSRRIASTASHHTTGFLTLCETPLGESRE